MMFRLRGFAVLVTVLTSLPAVAEDGTFVPSSLAARPRLQAQRAGGPIVIDGRLDDSAWQTATVIEGFVQYDPEQGAASKFTTTVRVIFDDRAIYVGARCADPAGLGGTRAPDLRRDFDFFQHDVFGISFDPFQTGRDAVSFQVNPYGALRDLQSFNDALYDREWDGVWSARTTRDATGWTVEMAIPWKTLRYPARATAWGMNVVRTVRRVQERSTWAPVPLAYSPYRMQYEGFLDGLHPPVPTLNLLLRPFLLGSLQGGDDRATGADGSAGADIKWAINTHSVLDVTANTDFAQIDLDQPIINLTRYDVLLPEKRSFFLENASLFAMGESQSLAPFSTRRVGLDRFGRPTPINAGLRMVSRDEDHAVGAMIVSTRGEHGEPGSQFAVLRATRDVSEQLQLGGAAVLRHDGTGLTSNWNVVPVADFLMRDGPLFVQGMASASLGSSTGAALYAYASHTTNQLYVGYYTSITSAGYAPEAGFIAASDTILHSPAISLDLRPTWKPAWVRSFGPEVVAYFYQRLSDLALQDGFLKARLAVVELTSGDQLALALAPQWHHVDTAFEVVPGLTVAPGSYRGARFNARLRSDQSRWWGASAELETGSWYDGKLTSLLGSAELRPVPQVSGSISIEQDRFADVGGIASRAATLVSAQLRLSWSPRLQLIGFYQRNTVGHVDGVNVRVAWELEPLSFFYLVYDDLTALDDAGSERRNWKITAKLAWTFQR